MITGIAGMERMIDKQIISLKNEIARLKHQRDFLDSRPDLDDAYWRNEYDEICYSLDHAEDMLVSLTGDIMVDM